MFLYAVSFMFLFDLISRSKEPQTFDSDMSTSGDFEHKNFQQNTIPLESTVNDRKRKINGELVDIGTASRLSQLSISRVGIPSEQSHSSGYNSFSSDISSVLNDDPFIGEISQIVFHADLFLMRNFLPPGTDINKSLKMLREYLNVFGTSGFDIHWYFSFGTATMSELSLFNSIFVELQHSVPHLTAIDDSPSFGRLFDKLTFVRYDQERAISSLQKLKTNGGDLLDKIFSQPQPPYLSLERIRINPVEDSIIMIEKFSSCILNTRDFEKIKDLILLIPEFTRNVMHLTSIRDINNIYCRILELITDRMARALLESGFHTHDVHNAYEIQTNNMIYMMNSPILIKLVSMEKQNQDVLNLEDGLRPLKMPKSSIQVGKDYVHSQSSHLSHRSNSLSRL